MIVPQKHHPSHRVRRRIGWGLLAVLLAYALAALIPCAFPPQLSAAEVTDTAWMETEASDLNANRGMLITTGQVGDHIVRSHTLGVHDLDLLSCGTNHAVM